MNEEEIKKFNKGFRKSLKKYLDKKCKEADNDPDYIDDAEVGSITNEQERRD